VPQALLAHHRQDSAGDVHWANEARRQLPLHLLRRQLLEVARVKAGSIVDQHVDAAEPVDSGPHRRLGIGAASDVQLRDTSRNGILRTFKGQYQKERQS
jgi:hypothetical protein